mgnify:CR=1 FL=1
MTSVTIFANRRRVEERLLEQALNERGHTVSLLDPASLAISLTEPDSTRPRLAIDTGAATPERATLAALIGASGGVVVNRAATTRLLADRLALCRHLIVAGIPVPTTEVAFGERATLTAIERVGYPAFLLSASVNPRVPDAVVNDRDAAEAIVEHRATLGHEQMTLVQEYVSGRTVRLPVVGSSVLTAEIVHYDADGAMRYEAYPGAPAELTSLAERVVSRLGSGVYDVKVVEGAAGPIVVKANNLGDFRTLVEAGIDVADAVAEFVLRQRADVEEVDRGD